MLEETAFKRTKPVYSMLSVTQLITNAHCQKPFVHLENGAEGCQLATALV